MSESETRAMEMPAGKDAPPAGDASAIQIHACWNQTGVYGDGSCPELGEYVHCRNCPAFSRAGVRLLDREMPAGYRQQWTAYFAAQKRRESRSASAVLFRIAGEWLALPTGCFQEIAERRPIHSLPHRGEGLVLGLVNVRGELLVAVSLPRMLGLKPPVPADRLRSHYHRLLVTLWEGHRFVFPVDEVHGPQRFHLEDLKAPPATLARSESSYTQGVLSWRGQTAGLLDPEELFGTVNRSLA